MSLEEQRKEIETIRERNIGVRLSDADCRRIAEKAARVGMTVEELIASFIGDLVDGTYTNGSDERMYAQRWFDRCGFQMMAEETLLSWLVSTGGVDWFMRNYHSKISFEKEWLQTEDPDEKEYLTEEIADCEDTMRREYDESGSKEGFEEAVAKVVAWVKRLEDM